MAKINHQPNPKVNQIFDELEKYLAFCVDYGYKFDESTLYDQRSNAYRQYTKYASGKNFRNCWEEDAKQMNSSIQ
jgi:hypothetical protein